MVHAQSSVLGCGDTITTSTTLSADIPFCQGNGLTIAASGVTLDCASHMILGTGAFGGTPATGAGINAISSDVTIKNCVVNGFNQGYYLASSGDTLTNDTAGRNLYVGFYLESGGDNLTGNSATGTGSGECDAFVAGVGFTVSGPGNTLTGNTADSNMLGYKVISSGNVLSENAAQSSRFNGFTVQSAGNTLIGNSADGNGIVQSGITCSSRQGGYGYGDTSSGSGTSGTGNLYEGNQCANNGFGGSDPAGLCSANPLLPTATTVSPNPATVIAGGSLTFTANVSDAAPAATSPTGTVAWSDNGAGGTFSDSGYCTLPQASSSYGSCVVTYTPPATPGAVTVTATYSGDVLHLGSSGSSALTVQTPAQATQALIGQVQALGHPSGPLNAGQVNSLVSKLNNVVAKLDAGKTTPALNDLGAFVNEVNALVNGGTLSQAQGVQLAVRAQGIAAAI